MRVLSWGSHLYISVGVWLRYMSLPFTLLGRFCGWSVCDFSGCGYCFTLFRPPSASDVATITFLPAFVI